MSPRPDLGPKPRLGYTASLIERAAERRADAAVLAALESDPRARAYAIGGELVVIKKTAAVSIRCSRCPRRARSVRPPKPCSSGCSRAPRALRSRSSEPPPRRSRRGGLRRHRSALDRGAGSGRGRPSAADRRRQGAAPLACAPPLLLQLRGGDQPRRSRLAARLPGLPRAALPAHRSGGDHAADRGRALRARPLAPLPSQHVVVPRGLRRAGRGDRGRRAARDPRGSRHRLRAGVLFRGPSRGRFPPR